VEIRPTITMQMPPTPDQHRPSIRRCYSRSARRITPRQA
jgi:hypothetical protein